MDKSLKKLILKNESKNENYGLLKNNSAPLPSFARTEEDVLAYEKNNEPIRDAISRRVDDLIRKQMPKGSTEEDFQNAKRALDFAVDAGSMIGSVALKAPSKVSKKALDALDKALPKDAYKQGFKEAENYVNSRVILKDKKPVGSIAVDDKNQVRFVELSKDVQGQGIGQEAYEKLANELGVLRSDVIQSQAGQNLWRRLRQKFGSGGKVDVRDAIDIETGAPKGYKIFQPNTNAEALKEELNIASKIRQLEAEKRNIARSIPRDADLDSLQRLYSSAKPELMQIENDIYVNFLKEGITPQNYKEALISNPEMMEKFDDLLFRKNQLEKRINAYKQNVDLKTKERIYPKEYTDIKDQIKNERSRLDQSLKKSGNVLATALGAMGLSQYLKEEK